MKVLAVLIAGAVLFFVAGAVLSLAWNLGLPVQVFGAPAIGPVQAGLALLGVSTVGWAASVGVILLRDEGDRR